MNGLAAARRRSAGGKFFSLDNQYIAPMFITTILLVGNLSFGMLESYQKTVHRDRQPA